MRAVPLATSRPGHVPSAASEEFRLPGLEFDLERLDGAYRLLPGKSPESISFLFSPGGGLGANPVRPRRHSTTALAVEGAGCERTALPPAEPALHGFAIGRPALARRLKTLLGEAPVHPVTFAPECDVRRGRLTTVSRLTALLLRPEWQPMYGSSFVRSNVSSLLIDSLLEHWPNSYSERLREPPSTIAPRHVKLAVDYIRDHIETQPTPGDLAQLAGVSLRALQYGFHQFVGTSIAAYLRHARLQRAHADLLADPGATVDAIARKWGFANAGRFSRYFRTVYGIYPSRLKRTI